MSTGSRPIIVSARLGLAHLDLEDAPFILALLNEPGFLRYIGDKGVRTLGRAREYLAAGPIASYQERGFGLYRTSLLSRDTPIGLCGLVKREGLADVDLGFAFLEAHWGQGYAAEAAAAVLDFGRSTLKIRRIVAITAVDNLGSRRVLEKVGFSYERCVRLTPDEPELNLFGSG